MRVNTHTHTQHTHMHTCTHVCITCANRYSEEDVDASMDRIEVVDFQQTLEVAGGIKVCAWLCACVSYLH